ncbi:MAG TPA: class I SAM-dependent methyltransferase [Ktedonobacterales bacterium]
MRHTACYWSQAKQPTGIVGYLFGYLMIYINRHMHEEALDHLDANSGETVLEIGFGHGATIRSLVHRVAGIKVVGIDVSRVMWQQAYLRNRRAIASGAVELHLASVSTMPFADETFTKVFAINSCQFWPDPEQDLHEVFRVLQPGGQLVLEVRGPDPVTGRWSWRDYSPEGITAIREALAQAGFTQIVTYIKRFRTLAAYTIKSTKPSVHPTFPSDHLGVSAKRPL